jgi:hypothetical protein
MHFYLWIFIRSLSRPSFIKLMYISPLLVKLRPRFIHQAGGNLGRKLKVSFLRSSPAFFLLKVQDRHSSISSSMYTQHVPRVLSIQAGISFKSELQISFIDAICCIFDKHIDSEWMLGIKGALLWVIVAAEDLKETRQLFLHWDWFTYFPQTLFFTLKDENLLH